MNGQFGLASLALPLVAAYLFISVNYYYRFKAHRLSGQKFAAMVLAIAVLLYLVSLILSAWLVPSECLSVERPKLASCLLSHWPEFRSIALVAPDNFASPAAMTLIVAIAVGVVGNFCLLVWESNDAALQLTNGRSIRERMRFAAIAHYVAQCDDPRMETLYRATFLKKPLCVTLSSGKAYIGIPILSLNPTADHSFLRLLPIASGHREEKDKRLVLTTKYTTITPYKNKLNEQREKVADKREHVLSVLHVNVKDIPHLPGPEAETAKIDLLDFGVVISWEQIDNLTIFDENIFIAFNLASPGEQTQAQAQA